MLTIRLIRKFYATLARASWPSLVLALVALFIVSRIAILSFEPDGSALREFWTFLWFFFVTGTTVGYGDYTPVTLGGRISTIILNMGGGIAILSATIAKGASDIHALFRRNIMGKSDFSHLSGHIVVLGWHGDITERMVNLIYGDQSEKRPIVIGSTRLGENPLPDRVHFVRGENLGKTEILMRTGLRAASRVIIQGHDDDQTLAVGIAVSKMANPEAHIVAYFDAQDYADLLLSHNNRIECIVSMAEELLVRAMQDPGSSRVQEQLLSTLTGPTQFALRLPETFQPTRYIDLLTAFKIRHDATLLGVADNDTGLNLTLNFPKDVQVRGGQILYFIASERIRPEDIDWAAIEKKVAKVA